MERIVLKTNLVNIITYIFLLVQIPSPVNGQIKIKAVGDVMLGSVTPKEILPPDSGKEFVNSIGNLLSNADIVFGNLEGAIINDEMEPQKCSDRSRDAGTCYEFGMPEYLAPVLKELGFNVLNQDNNHSEDFGEEGYRFTQQTLRELGIKFMPKQGYADFTFGKVRVAVVAFGYSDYSNNISDLTNAERIISNLNKIYDLIIVSFHGGAEGKDAAHVKDSTEIFLGENRGNVYRFAHTAIDAGADMVIGHGPHVLRAMEIYKNKLIAYSLGNFLTYGNINISGISGLNVILEAEIDSTNGDFIRGRLIPIEQIGFGVPVFDSSYAAIQNIKDLISEDIQHPIIIILKDGRIVNTQIQLQLPEFLPSEIKLSTVPETMKVIEMPEYVLDY
ncbi:CapA family protein [bacterium BMS3Abin03]|nr:CapA family protein [bacterium BMS3Abin03]MCG6960641.1 CapA family protein [bacterium BMS3Abin03]